jgi:hypothetical protein
VKNQILKMLAEIAQPTVYVIAGPNGAGKTTFATAFLPGFVNCREFVNADLIAAGLSPFDPDSQAVAAGRLMLQRIDELVLARQSFGFETTLSGRVHARRLTLMKSEAGYRVVLFFLWLETDALAISRVAFACSRRRTSHSTRDRETPFSVGNQEFRHTLSQPRRRLVHHRWVENCIVHCLSGQFCWS